MEYYNDGEIIIRDLEERDIAGIVEGELAQGWNSARDKYEMRLRDSREGRSVAFAAEYRGEIAGYINLYKSASGAFSGKDCTKVDRSASYAARYAAKNIVASGLAEKCEVQLSYAIGVAQPTSIMVDTFGTGKLSDERITEIVRENFDFRPAGIIKELTLRRPIYRQTAAYGHFGREDLDLPWERLDKVNELKKYL